MDGHNHYIVQCEKPNTTNMFQFPSRESTFGVYSGFVFHFFNDSDDGYTCDWYLYVLRDKFISLRIKPFQMSTSCENTTAILYLENNGNERKLVFTVRPCDELAVYNFPSHHVYLILGLPRKYSILVEIAILALEQSGTDFLNVSHHNNISGVVTPYGFDGMSRYSEFMEAFAILTPPPGDSVMLSYPHFDIRNSYWCRKDVLTINLSTFPDPSTVWMYCGTLQLPPAIYATAIILYFQTYIHHTRSGFLIKFSFHSVYEMPIEVPSSDSTTAVFNCSVPFYANFQQHLECNLEAECVHGEDEADCPYSRGVCEEGFLNAGSKCYKHVKTTRRMTWYDASAMCLKQGLSLASMSTEHEREAFLVDILHFAHNTFNVFIGLRTSASSLPAMYREVWQWSSGIMAYYVHIEEQAFKPTCSYFPALEREKISTTICGFYKYMQYIFCESKTPEKNKISSTRIMASIAETARFYLQNNTHFVTCTEGHITYDFLSCDSFSGCGAELGVTTCVTHITLQTDTEKMMEVLMYVCDSETQTIHYTQVCDHRAHCLDSSDEAFCIHPACTEKQCRNRQCITTAQWCDGMTHCTDGSDEVCPQFVKGSTKPSSISTSGFHVVLFDGHGKYKYVPQGSEFPLCPPSHFLCANRELCLPVYLRCNGVNDCPYLEDEDKCDDVTCPGYYRCRAAAVCVHATQVCDGVFECPQQDDELLCQLTCPSNCQCQGLAFVCPRPFPVQVYSDLRYLDASGSGIAPDVLFLNIYVIRLHLSVCGLEHLPVFEFPNLKFLDLGSNNLRNVSVRVFLKLSNLKVLRLSGNPLVSLVDVAKIRDFLQNVNSLDLSHTKLIVFKSEMLANFPNLKRLNLSHSELKIISSDGFGSLTQIVSLDLRGTELKHYPVKMLQPLSSLQLVYADAYKLCCQDMLPEQFNMKNCHASSVKISSCEHLLRSNSHRIFFWIICCISLFGNAGYMIAIFYFRKTAPLNNFSILIVNLNVADFLMGLYLVLILSADQAFSGSYLWHDESWKTSVCCKTASLLSVLSSQMSVLIIFCITLDLFLVTYFPGNSVHLRYTFTAVVCVVSWIIGFTLVILSLMSYWASHSQTSLCVPLPLTVDAEQLFSFRDLILLNFILFLLIGIGQLFIYMSDVRLSMAQCECNSREATEARRIRTVVMSDFLCWFSVGLLSLLASNGMSISSEVHVAMVIFVLPLNSALNPLLYTFSLLIEKRQKAAEERLLKILRTRLTGKSTSGVSVLTKEAAWAKIEQWLRNKLISSSDVEAATGFCISDDDM